jgi:hypothetical protein
MIALVAARQISDLYRQTARRFNSVGVDETFKWFGFPATIDAHLAQPGFRSGIIEHTEAIYGKLDRRVKIDWIRVLQIADAEIRFAFSCDVELHKTATTIALFRAARDRAEQEAEMRKNDPALLKHATN